MRVASLPAALQRLVIVPEQIVSILRPVVDMLRSDAMAAVEEKLRLQRMLEEKHVLIDSLKDEIFRKTTEHIKLSAQLEALKSAYARHSYSTPIVKTSENSSLPASRDAIGFKRTQWLRKKSERHTGGQPGHKGYPKEHTFTPNAVEQCAAACPKCGKPISPEGLYVGARRQIWNIPRPIAPIVTEYKLMEGDCGCGCHCRGEFPSEATAAVSYGPNVSALIGKAVAVPFERLHRLAVL